MKHYVTLLTVIVIALVFTGCQKFSQKRIYTANIPVYISYDELRSSIRNENDLALQRPGKIFLYNNYILINDFEQGIHVYNNANPSAPEHVAFIRIPGNVDMAIKNDILYADSYVDIVALDISDPTNVKEVGRGLNVLSYTVPGGMDWQYPVSNIDITKGAVIGYQIGEVEEECKNDECGFIFYDNVAMNQGNWGGSMMSEDGSPVSFAGTNNNNVRSVAASNNTAIAGSMARFLMVEDYLFAISDQSTVKVFDITSNSMTELTSFSPSNDSWNWGGNIETLFTFKEHLFIGSSGGMIVYNIDNPASPEYISVYTHMTSCDPVVANESHAFVTLRSGNTCGAAAGDQLDVLDIENIMNPFLLQAYPLSNPHGLSLDDENKLLFVCDGFDGLKVFNTSDINQLTQITSQSGETYDVITYRNIAHVIGQDGLVQYEYNESGQLDKLSSISLN